MTPQTIFLVLSLTFYQSLAWEALPQIPTGRRTQFLALHEDGGYKYGYDTGDGNAAKQSADAKNQVSGHYFYKNSLGQNVDLKYTAGVQGFVPEGLEKLIPTPGAAPVAQPVQPLPPVTSYSSSGDEASSGDASYSFNIDTDSYKRQESSDAKGNIKGSYSYTNAAGSHDLSYIAGENTGFVATSGSLSTANGLKGDQVPQTYNAVNLPKPQTYSGAAPAVHNVNGDGSYAFSYSTGDSSRHESADAGNNIQGRYSYQNSAGSHDLSYVAGAKTGFLVTGGSLAKPNGVHPSTSNGVSAYSAAPTPAPVSLFSAAQPSVDGSYSFQYSTGDQSRQESSDSNGNVRGSYSFKNGQGSHDLSYVAGSSTGFLPVGGSLSVPNGLADSAPSHPVPATSNYVAPQPSAYSSASRDDQANTGDASYTFNIKTDEYQRQESSDASGNVQGSYSYKNAADDAHDLSYVAGSQTGFLPTGGSLFNPKIAASPVSSSSPVLAKAAITDDNDDQANTGDSSYSFTIDTDEYKRKESSDANGNVQGSYSYKNSAGTHDLSYIAGSNTGFVATSGSLSDVNAIAAKIASLPQPASAVSPVIAKSASVGSENEEQSSGDASYSFSIDTDDYKRHETSDASGNIQGSYSYKNSVGSHDLSFVAGSATGFLPTGGSLRVPPGASEDQLRSGYSFAKSSSAGDSSIVQSYSAKAASPVVPSFKSSFSSDKNVLVRSYLPPSNEKRKFGYIYDTV